MYCSTLKINSKINKSIMINGFSFEQPFNIRDDNNQVNDFRISPGLWKREDIPKLLEGKVKFKLDGNLMTILEEADGTFLKAIGMTKINEPFFIKVPEVPDKIILNFSFEEEAQERPWNYPVQFGKRIELYSDLFIWVSGMISDQKINHPLSDFKVEYVLD